MCLTYAAYTRPNSGIPTNQVVEESSGRTTTSSATVVVSTPTAAGSVTGTLSSSTAEKLLKSAKSTETLGNNAVIEITIETQANIKTASVKIPATVFKKVASETDADVKLQTSLGTVSFDAKAVETISATATGGQIKIEIAKADTAELSETVKQIVGDRPIYDFTVSAGNNTVSHFNGGNANISIPYALQENEKPEAVVIYYVDDTGKLTAVEGKYDAAKGTVDFIVKHFSKYAVGYNDVVFNDVSNNAWYEKAVSFIAARDITTGVSDGIFAPNNTLTRGQFIVMLMRAYGIEADAAPINNFADAGNTYYTGYLAAAKRLGISNGIGNDLFAPQNKITRQDMFTLLYRALEQLGKLPNANASNTVMADFSDAKTTAAYAVEAMETFIGAGVVSGKNGELDPYGYSTRAQMAQVLYNLLNQ